MMLLGWLIGWAALRDARWALLPGLMSAGLIAVQPWNSTFGNIRDYAGWPALLVMLAMCAALLIWVPRLPKPQGFVVTSLLGPLLVLHVVMLAGLIFLSMIR
jgi:hypothetical protein